jgi:hypothetical protein
MMPRKKRVFARQDTEEPSEGTVPAVVTQSDDVKTAERLVDELLGSMTAFAISKGCGVNYLTVSRIAKGDSKRISHKVLRALMAFHTRFKSGELPPPGEKKRRGRKPKAAVKDTAVETGQPAQAGDIELLLTPTPAPLSAVNTGPIQEEIARLEHRLDVLRQMLELARQL